MTAWDGIFTVGCAGICVSVVGLVALSLLDPRPEDRGRFGNFLTGYLVGSFVTMLTGLVGMVIW